ncbi:glycosyltransferase [Actinocatenispora rupis]|uniref:Glycosyltransferase WbuB n=1 Tax=Actinocatenispora rupis TaxID=519421 RepID=A0A8J3NAB5_9ACTN|nr:glycosyltransferase [Actinocatenispora rupis]GID11931.1 glycosyltransferase WbuB [Actinocatenispora rupis]
MTRHVAVVVENVPLGVDIRLRKQVVDLLAAGYRVSVVSMRDADNAPYRRMPGLTLLEYPPSPEGSGMAGYVREYAAAFGWAAVHLARLRARGRIDVLQLCQPPDVYFPLARVLRWLGARVVVDQRDLMPEVFTARYEHPRPAVLAALRFLERRSQRVAHRTVCVNEYLRDRLAAAGGRHVDVVRNGPVLARVDQAKRDPKLRKGFRHLVVWSGKMGRQDRLDLAMRVVAEIVHGQDRTDCGFAFLGDGECLDEMRALAVELGVEKYVWLPGWVSEEQVFAYLASASLGLDTTLQAEVTPVKALEYLAFGLPLVSFDLPETRRIAAGAGVLVPPGEVETLAKEIVRLLDDRGARRRLGTVGRRRLRDELGWERQSAVYLEAIRRA